MTEGTATLSTPGDFDVVMCVGPKKVHTAGLAIRSLELFARPRRVHVIVSSRFFEDLRFLTGGSLPVTLIDEDSLIEGVSLRSVEQYLVQRIGRSFGAGHYLQQFLKMAACRLPDIPARYLVWDSDTIMLGPVEFFDENGRVLVNPQEEYHKPYFTLMKNLLGLDRGVSFSFISEHFMINSEHMRELLEVIESKNPGSGWVYTVLAAIAREDFEICGFSEFETYGNFVHARHPESYRCRKLNSSRNGASFVGMHPSRSDLYWLIKRGYAFVSFERWNSRKGWRVWPSKARSAWTYLGGRLSSLILGRDDEPRRVASALLRRAGGP